MPKPSQRPAVDRNTTLTSPAQPAILGTREVTRWVSAKSRLGGKLTYIARHWGGLRVFLEDGRVENLIWPVAPNGKNALFDAGPRAFCSAVSRRSRRLLGRASCLGRGDLAGGAYHHALVGRLAAAVAGAVVYEIGFGARGVDAHAEARDIAVPPDKDNSDVGLHDASDVRRDCHRMSAAMLSATRVAASRMESRARCAYRAVVSTWAWPSNLPITGRLSPSASAREAKLCRQS